MNLGKPKMDRRKLVVDFFHTTSPPTDPEHAPTPGRIKLGAFDTRGEEP